jgi:ABC-2 type transport system permease protein
MTMQSTHDVTRASGRAAASAPAVQFGTRSGIRKELRDTWLILMREILRTIREPVWVFAGLTQPIFYLLFFGPLVKNIPGYSDNPELSSMDVFAPGLLIQVGLFGAAFVGFGIISEIRFGIIERFRVTPVSRAALLIGRAIRDVLVLEIQGLLIIVLAWAFFDLHVTLGGVLATMLLMAFLGLALASISYSLGIHLKSEDALAPVLIVFILPIILLAGILLPLTYAPGWMKTVAKLNPLSYIVEASRELFAGNIWDATVAKGFIAVGIVALVGVWWGIRSIRTAAA